METNVRNQRRERVSKEVRESFSVRMHYFVCCIFLSLFLSLSFSLSLPSPPSLPSFSHSLLPHFLSPTLPPFLSPSLPLSLSPFFLCRFSFDYRTLCVHSVKTFPVQCNMKNFIV